MASEPVPSRILRPVLELQAGVLAFAGAILGGGGLFLMTVWLLVKGGEEVGPHLGLLGNYFPGYAVTWAGAVIGLGWGALTGAAVGATIGVVYNLVAAARAPR